MQPERPWVEWARFVELGVDSAWSVQMLNDGVTAERKVARQIGQRLDELTRIAEPTIDQVRHILMETVGRDEHAIAGVLNWYHQRET